MADLVNISIGNSLIVALLGYLVVFFGLILLMFVVMLLGKVMVSKAKKAVVETDTQPEETPAPVKAAPGTAGDLKLYDTDPRDAAMVMAIVADSLGKPLNELRFKSIKEVK